MFSSAKLKLKRAEAHVAELKSEFDKLRSKHSFKLKAVFNPQTAQKDVVVSFPIEPPEMFSLYIGDAIHNLKTALDHLAWELVEKEAHTAPSKNLYFPIGKDKESFYKFVNESKDIKQCDTWVKDLFISFQAYPGGKNQILQTIHIMDVEDKHKFLLPIINFSLNPGMKAVDQYGVEVLSIAPLTVGPTGPGPATFSFSGNLNLVCPDGDSCEPILYLSEPYMMPVLLFFEKAISTVQKTISWSELNIHLQRTSYDQTTRLYPLCAQQHRQDH